MAIKTWFRWLGTQSGKVDVCVLAGLGAIGWGLWEWVGPGPAKVVVGVLLIANGVGLARPAGKR